VKVKIGAKKKVKRIARHPIEQPKKKSIKGKEKGKHE